MVFSWRDAVANAAFGPFPGWSVIAVVGCFYAFVFYASLHHASDDGELAHGEVHV